MNKEQVMEKIGHEKVVPVIRTATADEARIAIQALSNAGITIFELTLTTPHAVGLIEVLAGSRPDTLVGAGTVMTADQAMQCVDAGAKFIVSPVFNREIVEFCNHRQIAVFPGGLTPGEIYLAWQAGADAVKVFPCNAMGGASYIRSLKAVFPEIRLFPSGGVTADNLKNFLNSGAFAAGAGTDLVDLELVRNGDTDLFHHRVRRYMQAAM